MSRLIRDVIPTAERRGWCAAHLDHHIALNVALATTTAMLVGPLELKNGALVKIHLAFAGARRICVIITVRVRAYGIAIVADLVSLQVAVGGSAQMHMRVSSQSGSASSSIAGGACRPRVQRRGGPSPSPDANPQPHSLRPRCSASRRGAPGCVHCWRPRSACCWSRVASAGRRQRGQGKGARVR